MATNVHMDLIAPNGELFEVPLTRAKALIIEHGWNPVPEITVAVVPVVAPEVEMLPPVAEETSDDMPQEDIETIPEPRWLKF